MRKSKAPKNEAASRKQPSTRKESDGPLKIILGFFLKEFAQLALGDSFKVLDAKLLDKEKFRVRKPKKHEMDALIETLVEDSKGVQMKRRLHLEFQGRGSRNPMGVRVLAYFSLMSEVEGTLQLPIDIVVFYINGAGKKDTGHHILGEPAIGEFNYHVIHLDEIEAEEILKSDNPLLLCLIGLSKLKNPQEEVQRAYHKIIKLSPEEDRLKYVSGLLMLLPNDSLVQSLEAMMQDGLLMDSPYMLRLERIKQENYALGLSEGKAEGLAQGLAEGKTEGITEGEARGEARGKAEGIEEGKKFVRDNIAAVLSQRFDPRVKEVTALQEKLQALTSYSTLSIALQKAALVDSFSDFGVWLAGVCAEKAEVVPEDSDSQG